MLHNRSQRWTASTIVFCLVLVALSWFALISPSRSEAADLQQQAAEQETRNIALQQSIITLKREYAALPATKTGLTAVLKTLPVTTDMPAVVEALRACEAHSGVVLTSITPGRAVVLAPQAGKISTSVAQTPMTLTLTGKFFQVSAFLNDLRGERMPRAFLVSDLNLATDASGAGSDQITVSVTGQIFSLPSVTAQIDKSEAAKAKAAANTSANSATTAG